MRRMVDMGHNLSCRRNVEVEAWCGLCHFSVSVNILMLTYILVRTLTRNNVRTVLRHQALNYRVIGTRQQVSNKIIIIKHP